MNTQKVMFCIHNDGEEIITLVFNELANLNDVRLLLGNLHMERFFGRKPDGISCKGVCHSSTFKLLGR